MNQQLNLNKKNEIWGKTIPFNTGKLKKNILKINKKPTPILVLAAIKDTFGTKVAKSTSNLDTYGYKKSIKSGMESKYMDDIPTVTPFLVEESNIAVIIAPGGGFYYKEKNEEGYVKAQVLNKMGISAFVLDYRVNPYRAPAGYMDLQRAVRYVRYYADELGISPNRIGTMGFSAGGFIAGAEEILLDDVAPNEMGYEADEIDSVSGRPDFMILTYPVTGFYRNPSMLSLLAGDDFFDERKRKELQRQFSLQHHLKKDLPPQFICYGDKDPLKDMQDYIAAVEQMELPIKKVTIPGASHGFLGGKGGWDIWQEELETWIFEIFPKDKEN